MSYDSLGRVVNKSYSDGSTPAVVYCYDGKVPGTTGCVAGATMGQMRRLTGVKSGESQTTYLYDDLGRVTESEQTTEGTPYEFLYGWNRDGVLKEMQYPSWRKVRYCLDPGGRPFATYANDEADCPEQQARSYVKGAIYGAHGSIETMLLGNGIVENTSYNARLQVTGIQAGDLLSLQYGYSADKNNGNVLSQTIAVSGNSYEQTYSYDGVNRLASAAESAGGVASWSQTYGYDRFGNRWVPQTESNNNALRVDLQTPQVETNIDGATNRVIGPGTYMYGDGRGNLTKFGEREFVYDEENRLRTSRIGEGAETTYSYDGEGRRVKKETPTETTVYVYDAMGQLAAEYATAASAKSGTEYLTVDHLGSTRLVTNAGGNAVSRHDYLPFGEEINEGVGGRTLAMGYAEDPYADIDPAQRFTGKERDAETGLDWFSVRYMSSAQGRFTSPDPLVWQSWQNGNREEQAKFQEFISDPQNFNLYTYGRNNPLKYNDPTGLDVEVAITFVGDVSDEEKKRIIGAVRAYLLDKKVGNVVVRDAADSSQDKRTFGQKVKDFFGATEYHSITVDLAHPNQFGNNADKPWFVKAFNMSRTGDPGEFFGDLRTNDPTQWSNIIAQRVLHETISHAFGIGPDSDQLNPIRPGDPRYGTLIEGTYGRGRPRIPGLNPADTRALRRLLVPRTRSYVP